MLLVVLGKLCITSSVVVNHRGTPKYLQVFLATIIVFSEWDGSGFITLDASYMAYSLCEAIMYCVNSCKQK